MSKEKSVAQRQVKAIRLKDFAERIEELVKLAGPHNPPIYYAIDEEGNAFKESFILPGFSMLDEGDQPSGDEINIRKCVVIVN